MRYRSRSNNKREAAHYKERKLKNSTLIIRERLPQFDIITDKQDRDGGKF